MSEHLFMLNFNSVERLEISFELPLLPISSLIWLLDKCANEKKSIGKKFKFISCLFSDLT